jgi:hypothetical protein
MKRFIGNMIGFALLMILFMLFIVLPTLSIIGVHGHGS